MIGRPSARLIVLAACMPFAVFVGVYLVLARHGLMLDDYAWILHSRVHSAADVFRLFTEDNGFYRPMVALTFAANEAMFGASPLGYGVTNVALALGCAAAIVALGRSLGLTGGASAAMAALWLLNFHGIRTAVLWVSGRTALVVILASVLAALAVVRGRTILALAALAAAVFAKEEAVLLPVILLVWILVLRRRPGFAPVNPWMWTAGAAGVLLVYAWARGTTNAMTPGTAPEWYQLTFDAARLYRNASIYLDQVATTAAAVTLVAVLLLGRPRPLFDPDTRRILALALAWVAGAFALTIWLMPRSDLYVCLPSVGVCLAGGWLCQRSWQQSSVARQRLALVAVLVVVPLAAPVHYLRTTRRGALMEFAQTMLHQLKAETADLPPAALVVLKDDEGARTANRPNLEDAFGPVLDAAYEVTTGRRLRFRIEPPVPVDEASPAPAREFALVGGQLQRIR
jgi:hypothetical protein